MTSYQQPPPQEPLRRKNEAKKKKLKRKASEVPTTTTAKIKKTEDSIKLLKNHLERNTCPKPLKYSARANILADEQFKKDIKAIRQKAKRGFVEALTSFTSVSLNNRNRNYIRKCPWQTVRAARTAKV